MTYRDHMKEALARVDPPFTEAEIEAILRVADQDTVVEIITGDFDREFSPPCESLVHCWNAVKAIARGGAWKEQG